MRALAAQSPSSIFERVIRPAKSAMTPAIAQAVLALKFSAADIQQMNRLLQATKDDVPQIDLCDEPVALLAVAARVFTSFRVRRTNAGLPALGSSGIFRP